MKGLKSFGSILIMMILLAGVRPSAVAAQKPIRLAIAGMTHTHIAFILGRADKGDFELVGIFETNQELVQKLAKKYKFSPSIVYHNLNEMLDKVMPEAVVAFGTIFDHLSVVEACAPRGIHVMVEKPLAVNGKHAVRMAELALKYKIHLLTNYEHHGIPPPPNRLKW